MMSAHELKQHLSCRAGEYFSDLRNGKVDVQLRHHWQRTNSTLYEFDLTGRNHRHAVLVKSPSLTSVLTSESGGSSISDRPRLCSKPHVNEKCGYEFAALLTIEQQLSRAQDERFGVVRMLDLLPDNSALVMEKAEGRTLNWRLLRASRFSFRKANRESLGQLFHNAGAWLRRFHQFPPLPHTRSRCRTRAEFIDSIKQFTDYLSSGGRRDGLCKLRDQLTTAAEEILPELLPLGLSHGDYAPRNVLSEECGRIRVIDTLARWRAPIYEDLARFIGGLKISQPQVWSFGLAYRRRDLDAFAHQFLEGYFGSDPTPEARIRLFECQAVLERWVAVAHRTREATGWKRVAKQSRQMAWEPFLKRQISEALRHLETHFS